MSLASRRSRLVASLIAVGLLAGGALAVVVRQPVTPASVKEKESRLSVEATEGADGMVRFTITYRPPEPQYVVAHFELRGDGGTVLARTDAPGFVREPSATYYVAVPGRSLKDATFELSANGMVETRSGPVGEPGGKVFAVDLAAFGKEAVAKP